MTSCNSRNTPSLPSDLSYRIDSVLITNEGEQAPLRKALKPIEFEQSISRKQEVVCSFTLEAQVHSCEG